jgi:predicted house-cleaning noncanonical NTP pyrophosphatase (MazG superfamily)
MTDVDKIEKLVRDKIPDAILKSGKNCNYTVLTEKEFLIALKKKVVEEANEVEFADCKEKMVEEIGDLLDVIQAIIETCSLSITDVNSSRKMKNEKFGGFSGRIFLKDIYKK